MAGGGWEHIFCRLPIGLAHLLSTCVFNSLPFCTHLVPPPALLPAPPDRALACASCLRLLPAPSPRVHLFPHACQLVSLPICPPTVLLHPYPRACAYAHSSATFLQPNSHLAAPINLHPQLAPLHMSSPASHPTPSLTASPAPSPLPVYLPMDLLTSYFTPAFYLSFSGISMKPASYLLVVFPGNPSLVQQARSMLRCWAMAHSPLPARAAPRGTTLFPTLVRY